MNSPTQRDWILEISLSPFSNGVFLFAIIFCSGKYLGFIVLCFISVIVGFPLSLTDLLYFVLMLYSDVRTSLKHKSNSQIQNHLTQTALLFSNRSCSSQCQMAHSPVLSSCNFVQML